MKRNERSSFKWHQENSKKTREQARRHEQKNGGFRCTHCKQWVVINEYIGTANRNHCNSCLWSRHVDEQKGDRKALCKNGMQPIGLTLKHEGFHKRGELMLIHECMGCYKISINRIAGDDPEDRLLTLFEHSCLDETLHKKLAGYHIQPLVKEDKAEILIQLFGLQ